MLQSVTSPGYIFFHFQIKIYFAFEIHMLTYLGSKYLNLYHFKISFVPWAKKQFAILYPETMLRKKRNSEEIQSGLHTNS